MDRAQALHELLRAHRSIRSAAEIEARFAQREERGRQRYMESSPEMARLWQEHGITSLAQYYTSKVKYDPDQFEVFSADLHALLRARGFLA